MARRKGKAAQAVIDALHRGEPMTAKRARDEFGCFRFHPLKNELTKDGYVFHSEPESGFTRYGEPTHWLVYRLVKRGK